MRIFHLCDIEKNMPNKNASNAQCLVIDLDGTLINTDTLHESVLKLFSTKPIDALLIPLWLSKGKAALKNKLAQKVELDVEALPYNLDLLSWLKEQKSAGRKLILCTATDISIANKISDHLGVFDDVMASDGITNIAGQGKADALIARFGDKGFDYVGNSSADLAVWKYANKAIVVNASLSVVEKAKSLSNVSLEIPSVKVGIKTWMKVFRVHQWVKNILLFIPLIAAHQFSNMDLWLSLIIAFFSFSFCASSVYIVNDLFDLDSDRQHPRKKKRPFASGRVPVWIGVCLAPILLLGSYSLATLVGGDFLPWLTFYFLLTCLYTWSLKRIVLLDCMALAMLYTLRILTGAAAASMALSFWLLAFSGFLFLSLAFIKRYAELEIHLLKGDKQKLHGRGYYYSDAPLVQTFGITAGYASVLVLALYLNSDAVIKLYQLPELIWAAVLVMLFWISWMWLQAHRGEMHDDPIVFALNDKTSLLAGGIFATVLIFGTIGISW